MSRVALPSFAALPKIWPDFSKKQSVFKIEVSKKYAPKFLSFNEKNHNDSDDFFESPILALHNEAAKLG